MKCFVIITDTYFLFLLKKYFIHRLEGTKVFGRRYRTMFHQPYVIPLSTSRYRSLQGELFTHLFTTSILHLTPTLTHFLKSSDVKLKMSVLELFWK